jgi:hypothetical protein
MDRGLANPALFGEPDLHVVLDLKVVGLKWIAS